MFLLLQKVYLEGILWATVEEQVLQAQDACSHLNDQPPDNDDCPQQPMDSCVTGTLVDEGTIRLSKLGQHVPPVCEVVSSVTQALGSKWSVGIKSIWAPDIEDMEEIAHHHHELRSNANVVWFKS